MIYVFDLDGTLCEESPLGPGATSKQMQQSYKNLSPTLSTIRKLRELYLKGDIIIIHSARHLEDYQLTKEWLVKHNVYHHELILGKVKGDHYVDVNCLRPDEL